MNDTESVVTLILQPSFLEQNYFQKLCRNRLKGVLSIITPFTFRFLKKKCLRDILYQISNYHVKYNVILSDFLVPRSENQIFWSFLARYKSPFRSFFELLSTVFDSTIYVASIINNSSGGSLSMLKQINFFGDATHSYRFWIKFQSLQRIHFSHSADEILLQSSAGLYLNARWL